MDVPPGTYTLIVEQGKETITSRTEVNVDVGGTSITLNLPRWIRMCEQGWYSGDTHVHGSLDELPNIVLAEDLNVALPLTAWVTRSGVPPAQGDKTTGQDLKAEVIQVDDHHLIWPINTEDEIFSVGSNRHTLGAVISLYHKTPLETPAPPVEAIARETRRQGGLLDLDKHDWR